MEKTTLDQIIERISLDKPIRALHGDNYKAFFTHNNQTYVLTEHKDLLLIPENEKLGVHHVILDAQGNPIIHPKTRAGSLHVNIDLDLSYGLHVVQGLEGLSKHFLGRPFMPVNNFALDHELYTLIHNQSLPEMSTEEFQTLLTDNPPTKGSFFPFARDGGEQRIFSYDKESQSWIDLNTPTHYQLSKKIAFEYLAHKIIGLPIGEPTKNHEDLTRQIRYNIDQQQAHSLDGVVMDELKDTRPAVVARSPDKASHFLSTRRLNNGNDTFLGISKRYKHTNSTVFDLQLGAYNVLLDLKKEVTPAYIRLPLPPQKLDQLVKELSLQAKEPVEVNTSQEEFDAQEQDKNLTGYAALIANYQSITQKLRSDAKKILNQFSKNPQSIDDTFENEQDKYSDSSQIPPDEQTGYEQSTQHTDNHETKNTTRTNPFLTAYHNVSTGLKNGMSSIKKNSGKALAVVGLAAMIGGGAWYANHFIDKIKELKQQDMELLQKAQENWHLSEQVGKSIFQFEQDYQQKMSQDTQQSQEANNSNTKSTKEPTVDKTYQQTPPVTSNPSTKRPTKSSQNTTAASENYVKLDYEVPKGSSVWGSVKHHHPHLRDQELIPFIDMTLQEMGKHTLYENEKRKAAGENIPRNLNADYVRAGQKIPVFVTQNQEPTTQQETVQESLASNYQDDKTQETARTQTTTNTQDEHYHASSTSNPSDTINTFFARRTPHVIAPPRLFFDDETESALVPTSSEQNYAKTSTQQQSTETTKGTSHKAHNSSENYFDFEAHFARSLARSTPRVIAPPRLFADEPEEQYSTAFAHTNGNDSIDARTNYLTQSQEQAFGANLPAIPYTGILERIVELKNKGLGLSDIRLQVGFEKEEHLINAFQDFVHYAQSGIIATEKKLDFDKTIICDELHYELANNNKRFDTVEQAYQLSKKYHMNISARDIESFLA